ncbi:MAG TPA: hypothetical protein VM582_04605 [Candidatus Thermoplasmatota archaeon]|nr:hypothetical protein [Candidatus Thermoplasmatota archaeon]
MRWLVLLVLLAPGAAAAASFEGEGSDAADDVRTPEGARYHSPSTDVRAFRSQVVDGVVEQRVTMAAAPSVPGDSIVVRNWFRHSVDGSFHVVDLEVHGKRDAPEVFRAFTRRNAYANVSPIDATYRIEGDAWVFAFDAAVAPDAECYTGMVYAFLPAPGLGPYDTAGMAGAPCATTWEPPIAGGAMPAAVVARTPTTPREAPSDVDAPGSRTPSAGISAALVVAALAVGLLTRWRR